MTMGVISAEEYLKNNIMMGDIVVGVEACHTSDLGSNPTDFN